MRTNKELMNDAKTALQGQWLLVAGCALLYLVLISAGGFILAGAMGFGFTLVIMKIVNREKPSVEVLFSGFNRFLETFLAGLLMMIFVALWTMLFFIPGIVAALRYSMTYFIMVDNPTMTGSQAINKSCEMMRGHKWSLFCLQCRFIGWGILCMFTFGIGNLFLMPYMQATVSLFYQQLKAQQQPVMATPPAMPAE